MKTVKKFFGRSIVKMGLIVMLSMLFIIGAFSDVLFRTYETKSLKIINEYNKKSLSQIAFLITYTNDMIKNYCFTQLTDPDIAYLMVSGNIDLYNSLNNINIISSIKQNILSNPMIDSVIIYNGQKNIYFSSYGWTTAKDEFIVDFFEKNKDYPVLTPIPRLLPFDVYYKKGHKVFTYFFKDPDTNSGIAINVNTDWIFSNLNRLKDDTSNLILIDMNGSVIGDSNNSYNMLEKLEDQYFAGIKENSDDSLKVEVNNDNRIITQYRVPNMDLILISNQPYDQLYKYINELKNDTVYLTLIFLIFALIISTLISKLIYKPFNNLVKRVKYELRLSLTPKNDIEYLSEVFNNNLTQFKAFDEYKTNTRNILKENLLKTMLLESNTTNNLLSENLFDEYNSAFSNMKKIIIVLFKIDDFIQYVKNDNETRKYIRLTISSTANRCFSKIFQNEVILMGNGECVVIIDVDSLKADDYLYLIREIVKEIQTTLKQFADISLSAFISTCFSDINLMNRYYKELQNMINYRILYGQNIIIEQERIEEQNESSKYPENLESEIIDSLNYHKLEAVVKYFNTFIEVISKMNIDNFMLSITRLVLAINKSVNDTNINRINEIIIDIDDFCSKLMKHENIENIKSDFIKLFESIINQNSIEVKNKHSTVVNSIKEYIDDHLNNKDLCLKMISDLFNLSSVHLGVIFKDNTKESVQEYINKKRLEKATYYLKSTNKSVYDILEITGFDNETNFYRLFKKYYGVTPNDYRIGNRLKEHSSKE